MDLAIIAKNGYFDRIFILRSTIVFVSYVVNHPLLLHHTIVLAQQGWSFV
jgi:hypothetical protein